MDAIPNEFEVHAMDPMATFCEFTIAKANPVYTRYCQHIWTRWMTLHIWRLSFENKYLNTYTHIKKKENT